MPQMGPIMWLVPMMMMMMLLLFMKTSLAFPKESGTEVKTTKTKKMSWKW